MQVLRRKKKNACLMQADNSMGCIGKLLGYVLLGFNGGVALLLLLSAYSPYFDPQNHSMWSSVGILFPVFLLLNVVFFVLWLFLYWRYALLPLITFCLCWNTISSYCPINVMEDGDLPEDAIKVLSYNTLAFGLKAAHTKECSNEVLAYLQKSDADIICLQEYIWGGKLKKKDIDYALRGYPYKHYHSLGNGLNGLGVYSRFPILSVDPLKYKSNRNGSVAYRVKVKKDTLLVINNHLESNKIAKSDVGIYQDMIDAPDGEKLFTGVRKLLRKMAQATSIRAGQVDVVLDKVKTSEDENIIVCGDFNDTPVSYVHRVLHDELNDAFVESGNGLGVSYNRDRLYVRIDHILTSKNLKVYDCTVDNTIKASDHYPIWCYISLDNHN